MNKFIIVLLAFGSISCRATDKDDWTSQWFGNAVTTNPNYFKSQQRGYYSAGGFSNRLDLQNDYLMSINMPKISAGCGGIDVLFGGISMLDAEYVLKKLQRILQAAPSFAFDMALKNMCKECSETMSKMEAITNMINNLQLNECAISKRIVTTVDNGNPNVMGEIWSEISASDSLKNQTYRHWKEAQEKIQDNPEKNIPDLKETIKGCHRDFQEIFKNGSLIDNSIARYNSNLGGFADLIRGYVGDVKIIARAEDKIPLAYRILPCPENKTNTLEDMLNGRSCSRSIDGKCSIGKQKGILQITREKLINIASKIKNKQSLLQSDINFINSVNLVAVLPELKTAILQDRIEAHVDSINEIVATNYTWYVFDDLYRHIDNMLNNVNNSINTPNSNAGRLKCDTRAFAPAINQFKKLHKRLKDDRKQLNNAWKHKTDLFHAAHNLTIANKQNTANISRQISQLHFKEVTSD